MRNTIKRHLISAFVTFLAMFLVFLWPAIEVGNWEVSVLVAAMLAAARSALKFVWELFLLPLLNMIINWAKNYTNKNSNL